MNKDEDNKKESIEPAPAVAGETNITSGMIENAHASGAGSIKRSDEEITGKEGERRLPEPPPQY